MSNLLGKFLTEDAKQTVLKYKLVAVRKAVTNVSFSAGSTDVSTAVTAVAAVDTPISDLSALGIYTGAISSAADVKRVLIRAAGTDEGIQGDNGDEIYGVMSEAAGVFTVTLKNSDGSAFVPAAPTSVDLMFVENMDLNSMPVDAILLNGSIGGVIDASNVSAITSLDGRLDAAESNIAALEAADIAIDGRLDALEASDSAIDGRLDALEAADVVLAGRLDTAESEIDALQAADVAIDGRLDALEAADVALDGRLDAAEAELVSLDGRLDTAEADISALEGKEPSTTVVLLTEAMLTAKAIDLSLVVGAGVKKVLMVGAVGGLIQCPGIDYTVVNGDNGLPSKIQWNGLGMDVVQFEQQIDRIQFIILGG